MSALRSDGGPTRADAPRAGRVAAWLIGPHLALGGWLMVVPDHRAFLTNQVITLLHTVIALVTLPLAALYIVRHASRMVGPKPRRTVTAFVVRWLLASTVTLAMLSGLVVIWSGNIIDTARLHTICGLLVGVPLAWHLLLSKHHIGAALVALVLVGSLGGSVLAKRLLPPKPLETGIPPFAFQLRPAELYEPSKWCGECHTTDYEEWSRSTHARTLDRKSVRNSWVRMKESTGFDLADVGRIVKGEKPPHFEAAIFSCEACHAPTSFYSDDKRPVMQSKDVTDEGISCAFCHTIRDVNPGADVIKEAKTELRMNGTADFPKLMGKLPSWVSAPETVRRYLGQGSKNPALRQIGNWLIRWRPQVHTADYHAPILDTSRACLACHGMGGLDEPPEIPHKTYISWKQSRYNTGDPATTVTCQDCHMVKIKHMNGKRVKERYQLVPWGPEREPGRNHFLVGGNVDAGREMNDEKYMRMAHKFNLKAATLAILGTRREGGELHVTVKVRNELAGHYLPAMETHVRFLWVAVAALDAAGNQIAETPKPRSEEEFDGASPLIFRCTEQPKPECDTLVRPNSDRDFVARLALPEGAKPARLEARLYMSMDFLGPIARVQVPFDEAKLGSAAPSAPTPAPATTGAAQVKPNGTEAPRAPSAFQHP